MCPAQFGRTWKKGLGASVTLRQLGYIGGNGGRLIKEKKDKKWFAHPGLIAHDRGVDIYFPENIGANLNLNLLIGLQYRFFKGHFSPSLVHILNLCPQMTSVSLIF